LATLDSPLEVLFLADEFPPVVSGRARLLGELLGAQPREATRVITSARGRGAGPAAGLTVLRLPTPLARFGGMWARRHHVKWAASRRSPGLVVACGLGAEAALARTVSELTGAPIVLHLEGPTLALNRRKLRAGGAEASQLQTLLDEAAGIVTATEACRLEAYKCGVLPQQLDVIPPGVDLEAFRPGPPSAELAKRLRTDSGPVLLTVAGRGPAKDLETVYKAFAVVRGQRRDAVLIVVGADEGRERKSLRKLRVERHVRFLPSVEPANMPELYRLASAYVTAHREDPEKWILAGVEVAVVEALASGVPVFGTRVPVIEELAPPDEVGMLVEPEAHQKLGRVLLDTLADEETIGVMRTEARARAERLHSAAETGAAFRELMEVICFRRLGRGNPGLDAEAPERSAA
jgi:glycosyltransferase involved in cell wall biosynthesis